MPTVVLLILSMLSTLGVTFWLILFASANGEDILELAYVQVLVNRDKIAALAQRERVNQQKLDQYNGVVGKIMRLFYGSKQKEIAALEKVNAGIQANAAHKVNAFALAGYTAQRKFPSLRHGSLQKRLFEQCKELYGRKNADRYAMHLIARIVSYLILGISLNLGVCTMLLARRNIQQGFALLGIGMILIIVLVYAMYDEVSDRVKKRRAQIERQFPNVVSKIALLVSSGMIVTQAWQETAYSREETLYQEMRLTAEELGQNIPPDVAYGNFISRCNTKETTKLASSIIQSLSKGNSEIAYLLRMLAKESWMERKHSAKRNAEKANSKLVIPSMLLFVTILIIIMVPVASSFSNL